MGLIEVTYKMLYHTGADTPKFYGLPKIHKARVPLRPTVSSRGAVFYGTAKELARIWWRSQHTMSRTPGT